MKRRIARLFSRSCLVTILCTGIVSPVLADWPRFRGPNGTGIAEDKEPTPIAWNSKENLKWKIELPGSGVSSPIIVGNRVFVTCYSGYGINGDDPGDIQKLVRHIVCVDSKSGTTLWKRELPAKETEDQFAGMGVPQHGYASHTPASDGKRVYAFFGKSGVVAYDLDGNELWKHSVGTGSDDRRWGSSSSPIVHDNTVVVTAGPESRAIYGLNKDTGEERWKLESRKLGSVWGTPAIVKVGNKSELVIGAPSEIWGIDADSGKTNWYCQYTENSDQFNSSVVVDGDTVYAIEGRGGGSVAVKAGGKDDVTDSQIVWKGRESSQFASPLIYDGRVYYVSRKVLNCVDAKTHEKIFEGRMRNSNGEEAPAAPGGPGGGPGGGRGGFGGGGGPGGGGPGGGGRGEAGPGGGAPGGGRGGFGGGGPGGPGGPGGGAGRGGFGGQGGGGGRGGFGGGGGRGGFGGQDYSSPVLADGKIYFTARNGETYVFRASKEFEQLAVNRVTLDTEDFSASPAISHGEIFLRSNKHLYCISSQK